MRKLTYVRIIFGWLCSLTYSNIITKVSDMIQIGCQTKRLRKQEAYTAIKLHQPKDRRLPMDNAVMHGSGSNSTRVEDFKARILQSTRVIKDVKECRKVIDDIFSQVVSRRDAIVAIDCEGVNLGATGYLTSIQLKQVTGQIFIFDVHKCKQLVYSGGLKKLLESQTIVKVIHCCQSDRENLLHQFGVKLTNAFDTQVGHQLLEEVRTGQKVGQPSLNKVCEAYGAPQNPLKDKINGKVYRKNPRFWAQRPLTEDMLLYSAADVDPLVPHVFNAMVRSLEEFRGCSDRSTSPAEIYFSKFINLPVRKNEKSRTLPEVDDCVNEQGELNHEGGQRAQPPQKRKGDSEDLRAIIDAKRRKKEEDRFQT